MNDRLRRLLLLVPAAWLRPGTPVVEMAAALGCTADELRAEVEQLACLGVPPFNPDDLVDIWVEDDRVYVHLPQTLDQPLRLTAMEAAALDAAGRALAPGDTLVTRALSRIQSSIAPAHRALYAAVVHRLATLPEHEAPEVIATIDHALQRRRPLRLLYQSPSDTQPRWRDLYPRALGSVDGVRYLCARTAAGEERLYRLDRASAAELGDGPMPELPPDDSTERLRKLSRMQRQADLPRATLRFAASVHDAARLRHPDGRDDGDAWEADVAWGSLDWLVSYVLSWGGNAIVIGPAQARAAVAEQVDRLAATLL